MEELEKWLSIEEHIVLLQGTWDQIPEPMSVGVQLPETTGPKDQMPSSGLSVQCIHVRPCTHARAHTYIKHGARGY